MGFLDDIGKKLTAVSQEAISQGSALAGTAKNKVKTVDLERQLNGAFAELGRKFYETIKDGSFPEYADNVTRIKDLMVQIEFYKAETRRERGMTLCPKCGAEVVLGASFCSSCGNTMPQVNMTQQNTQSYMVVRCPQCGVELPNGTVFCTSCGTNLSAVQPSAPSAPLGAMTATNGSFSTPSVTAAPAAPVQSTPVTAAPSAAPTAVPTLAKEPVSEPKITLDKAPEAVSASAPKGNPVPMPTPNPVGNPVPMPTPSPVGNPVPMPSPTAPQPGFPKGGPSTMAMDIDTKTIYGDTNAPYDPGTIIANGISLDKN